MPSSGLAAAGFPEVLDFLWACKGVVVFRVPGFRVCSLGPVDLRHVQGLLVAQALGVGKGVGMAYTF